MGDLESRLSRLGIALETPLPDGASCTRLFRARSAGGEALVVKVLGHDPARVDGHDAVTFRRKRRQIDWLCVRYPQVGRHYVPILHQLDGPGWTAHVLPFVAGDHLLAAPEKITAVLERLAEIGYARQDPCRGADYVRAAHLERIRRRLRFLAPPAIPQEALSGRGYDVNGHACLPLDRLLAWAEEQLDRLAPRTLAPPVHGDLNTRNVIVHEGGFSLIDPRGTLNPVDVCYDLGKILLSVSIWDPALRCPPRAEGSAVDWVVPRGHHRLLTGLPQLLRQGPALTDALRRSGEWEYRLAFSHAIHALAEAACRVSDARAKGVSAAASVATVRAFFALGAVLLTDLVRRRDFDLSVHLAVTERLSKEED